MLALTDLTLAQGGFRLHADLRVATGARVALIGPSGAGKTTLLSAIAGFLAPARGRILWNGADITALPPGARLACAGHQPPEAGGLSLQPFC